MEVKFEADEWLTVVQVSKLCGISRQAVHKRLLSREAPLHKRAGKRLILINKASFYASDWLIRRR